MWRRLLAPPAGGGGANSPNAVRAGFNATYVSPGKVRTAQALAVSLAGPQGTEGGRACLVIFETLSGRA
jgi:hypothetical protein